jgi:phenylpyruvate tautomerase PptA (4-oxalocrotonate tautomerase family)
LNKSNNDVFAANLRVSEALKAELVEALSDLFKATLKNDHTKTCDSLATIITITYILGRKMGIDFTTLDYLANQKLQAGIMESDEEDQWFDDMRYLMLYLDNRKRG